MTDSTIQAEHIDYSYPEENTAPALQDINFCAQKGEFIAFIGANGSGKTTFARHINGLLKIRKGTLKTAGFDVSNPDCLWELRKHCGMVFQNPDNQFVSPLIEEDTAFGLENYDWPTGEIPGLVHKALEQVGLAGYEKKSPSMLSGGQKQKLALAGVLVMKPDIIIFDEATSMLDPCGKAEVMNEIRKMHAEKNKTLIIITHSAEEAAQADRILVFNKGRIVADGKPCDIFSDEKLLQSAGLEPPLSVRFYLDLKKNGIELTSCPLTVDELAEQLCALM
ncbi:energy-coupling factor transporter ATPase [Treponema sp. OMZ 840]|uniref:energy-coupling factor transporter ATPase n=1 Tax=Treponema sp. OMZ 840 TaxID=244313 RepID=UPI003D9284E0